MNRGGEEVTRPRVIKCSRRRTRPLDVGLTFGDSAAKRYSSSESSRRTKPESTDELALVECRNEESAL